MFEIAEVGIFKKFRAVCKTPEQFVQVFFLEIRKVIEEGRSKEDILNII